MQKICGDEKQTFDRTQLHFRPEIGGKPEVRKEPRPGVAPFRQNARPPKLAVRREAEHERHHAAADGPVANGGRVATPEVFRRTQHDLEVEAASARYLKSEVPPRARTKEEQPRWLYFLTD